MNHSFIRAPWSDKVCAKCAIPEFNKAGEATHSDKVTCEACSSISEIHLVNKMLLCAVCRDKETQVTGHNSPNEIKDKLSLEQVVNQVNRILNEQSPIVNASNENVYSILDRAIQGDIKQYKDFFNANMPSIAELEAIIGADDSICGNTPQETMHQKSYALAVAMRSRINYLTRVIFATESKQVEMAGEVKSIQFYMSELIPKLRTKLRLEFAQNTPNYTPQVVVKEKKQRAANNPQERLAESYAKAMKISIEEARRKLANKLRDECTCSETPGMCKVHNNIKENKK